LLFFYRNKTVFSKKDFKLFLIKEKENRSNSIVNFNLINKFFPNYYGYPNETTTPLHVACYYAIQFSCTDIMKILIQCGANVNIQDNKGVTPLMICQFYKHNYPVMKLLIDNNANVCIKDIKDNTILHKYRNFCIEDIDDILLESLLNMGINIDKRNDRGYTPLMNLIYHYMHRSFISLLINHGADMNIINNEGDTPLLMACKTGNYDLAQALIEGGADVNIGDREGNTPLIIAFCEKNYTSLGRLFKYLIGHGADVNKANHKGETPMHMA